MKKLATFVTLAFMIFNARAETTIGGSIAGMTIDSTGNPYVVDRDIVVPRGKNLTIKEGCVLMFKPFTGVTVQGNLDVEGTQEHPVLFTSVNDTVLGPSDLQPNAFDWNGIVVAKESGTVMVKFANLRYSVFGIKCQNPDILIMNSVFRQNGQFHFTVNDKIVKVEDDRAFSYGKPQIAPESTTSSPKSSKPPASMKRNVIRYTSLGVGVVGLGVGTVYLTQFFDTKKKMDAIKSDPAQFQALNTKYVNQGNAFKVLYGLGAMGLTGFTLTFVF